MGDTLPFQRRFIKTGTMLVQVMGNMPIDESSGKPVWNESMIPGKGYIYKGYVWVFQHKSELAPYPVVFHQMEESSNNLSLLWPSSDDLPAWSVDNIRENSFDDARTVSEDRIILSSEMIEAMNNASSSYKPTIAEGDDFLKRLVKTTIRMKDVDLNRLKAKMSKSYGLSNLKSALKGTTKMSVNGFRTWMVLLGLDFTVTVETPANPAENREELYLQYSSETDKVTDVHGAERMTDEGDDYLKRLVKLMFGERDADSSALKAKMSKTYGFSNLMQALRGTTKMSVNGFLTWLDLLDSSAEFMLYDNGLDRLNPLKDNIYYSTITDKITDKEGVEIIIHEEDNEEHE